jgi:1-acyl-sn-glycerol-3-phosphate acyltransferase
MWSSPMPDTNTTPSSIRVPRRRLVRAILRFLGRLVAFFVARVRVVGLENIPTQRPLIIIANHIDDMDGFALALYLPFLAEIMVAADMPVPWIARVLFDLYGYIPVMRGTGSGDSTKLALSVLEQKGIVILFPEGGIWRSANKPVHTGVAWLSQKSQAAVLPIGIMGTRKALPRMMKFKRPAIELRIGKMIPPPYAANAPYNKAVLQTAANSMMAAVEALIPQQERQQVIAFDSLELGFETQILDAQNQPVSKTSDLSPEQSRALGKLYYDISILETLWKGNKIPIQALAQPHTPQPASGVVEAVDRLFAYLQNEYAPFFSYRFGKADDEAIQAGFRIIQQQARAAGAAKMILTPIARASEVKAASTIESAVTVESL